MLEFDIEIEGLEDLLSQGFSDGMIEAALPNTANAFRKAQGILHNAWADYLAGETSLDGIESLDKVNPTMIRSIKDDKKGDLEYIVYSNDQQMEKATKGTPDVKYDMKQTHPYGRKSRVSAEGIPYLIIPFRWGTPNGKGTSRRWNNSIPQKEYRTNMLPMEVSLVKNKTHLEQNAHGEMIPRAEYIFANRLKENEAWNDRSVGMVRMRDVGKKSTYFTFRIISAKSDPSKWWYFRKGNPGIDIIGALERTVGPAITELIKQGVKNDEDAYSDI